MRYYDIRVTNPATGQLVKLPSGQDAHWTTWFQGPNGRWQNDPGAPLVEFDLSIAPFATPIADHSFLRIWGVSVKDISQAANLAYKNITVRGGMKPGLPLATAQAPQAGILAQGTVYPSFGNWQGTNQSLDLNLTSLMLSSPAGPKNIVLNWRAGMPLSTALMVTLKSAFPDLTVTVAISPNFVLNHDETGSWGSITAFAGWLLEFTKALMKGATNYPGVSIVAQGNRLLATDGTAPVGGSTKLVAIEFSDMVGQPSWLDINTISIKTVLRGDIGYGDIISLPATAVTNTAASSLGTQPRNLSSFTGTFMVNSIRHVGNSRQPDGDAWATIFTAVPVSPIVSNVVA